MEEAKDNSLSAVDYNKIGTTFVTVGTDRKVKFYDNETMKLKHESASFNTDFTGHNNRVYACKFSTDDPNLCATGGWDQTVLVHDIRK